jgi:tetratricopeptide (TPR) repeat protein
MDLRLRFTKLTDKDAPFDALVPVSVHLNTDQGDTPTFDFRNPLTDADLTDLRWYIERYPAWPVGPDYDRAQEVQARLPVMGRALFDAVFQAAADAMRLFERFDALRTAEATLTVETAEPRILRLPWELLADAGGYLFSRQPALTVRRRMRQTRTTRVRPFDLPVRILLAVSRPEGDSVGFIDPRSSAEPLLDAVEALGDRVEVEFLRPPTVASLTARLRDRTRPPVHVLHFDGHGIYDPGVGLGFLLFEDDAHRPDRVDAERLGALLNDCGVPLAILDACQTATPDERNPFGSVATRLIESGVGGVVAMNYSVLVPTARALTGSFYRGLAAGESVAASLDAARLALLADTRRFTLHRGDGEEIIHLQDWFVPALYQQEAELRPFARGGRRTKDGGRKRAPATTTLPRQPDRAGFPPEPVHGFHGRARELLALERLFAEKPAVVLHGFGGQGKISLAAHAAWWLTRTGLFERAAFLSFEDGRDLDVVLAELGAALVGDNFAIHAGDKVQAIADALAATPTLVVFDNFESVLPTGDVPLPPAALKALLDAAERWFGANDVRCTMGDVRYTMDSISHRTSHIPHRTSHIVHPISRLLTTRDPALPHAFLTPGRTCARYELPGLAGPDALEFAGTVLADGGLPRPPRDALARLLDFLGGHPLSIQLVLPHLAEAEVKAKAEAKAEDGVGAVIEEFDALLPGFTAGAGKARNQSLEVSLRFSLRRLGAEAAALLPRLAVFRGGATETVLLRVTEIDEATWAAVKPALANAALIRVEALPGVSVPYIHFHPTLAPFLAQELTEEQTAALEDRYWRGYYEFATFLYQSDTQNPIQARALAARELPNLRRGLRLALAAAALDEAVDFAKDINLFLDVFGRWRERDEVAAEVEAGVRGQESGDRGQETGGSGQGAGGESGDAVRTTQYGITKSQFILETGRGERLRQAGRAGEAEGVFRALLGRLDAGAMYDTGYDRPMTLQRIGRCLAAQGRPVDAAAQYRAGLAAAGKLEQTEQVRRAAGVIHTDLADVLADMGQHAAARAEYEAALAIAKQTDDERQQGVVLGQLGTLALAQGDLAEARGKHGEALALFQGIGEVQMEAVAWHLLGVVAQEARDWAKAERCYKEALRIREQIRDLPELAKTCNQLAMVAVGAGRPAEAERWYRRAIELDERIGNPKEIAPDYGNLAGLLLAQGRLDEAEGYAQRARAIMETLDLSAEPWKTYAILAEIAERRGQVAAARGWRRKEQETFAAFAGSEQKVKQFEPLIEAVALATRGNAEAAAYVQGEYPKMQAGGDGWSRTAAAIQRLVAGERDIHVLADGLSRTTALVIRCILARLAGDGGTDRGMNSPSDTAKPAEAGWAGEAAAAEPTPAQEAGLTLPQLLDLVERAARGDQQLGSQLFDAMRGLASDPGQPAELRALGKALTLVLIGDHDPNLDRLPPELASAVRGLLGRLRAG